MKDVTSALLRRTTSNIRMRVLVMLVCWAAVQVESASVMAASAGRVVSLDEALRLARQHQPLLRQARAGTEAAAARVDAARSGLLPQLSGTAGYQRTTANFALRPGFVPQQFNQTGSSSFKTYDYFNFGLNANMLAWDFQQTWGRWGAAKASARAELAAERSQRLQVALNVRVAYFSARAAKAMVRVADETLTNQQRHLEQIEGFVQVGTRPAIDLAQARTDVANARVQLINAQNGYDVARAQLNQAIGIEAAVDYDVADETLPPVDGESGSAEALREAALRARPELAQIAAQVRAQELTLKATRGGYWPTLSVSTDLTEAGGALDNMAWNWSAGLSLSWALFEGLKTVAQVREANANLTAASAQLDAQRQQIGLQVEQARLDVRAARAALQASGDAVTNARDRLELAEGRYQTGVGNAIELGDAQLALTSALAQQVQSDYTLASARAKLLQAIGR